MRGAGSTQMSTYDKIAAQFEAILPSRPKSKAPSLSSAGAPCESDYCRPASAKPKAGGAHATMGVHYPEHITLGGHEVTFRHK